MSSGSKKRNISEVKFQTAFLRKHNGIVEIHSSTNNHHSLSSAAAENSKRFLMKIKMNAWPKQCASSVQMQKCEDIRVWFEKKIVLCSKLIITYIWSNWCKVQFFFESGSNILGFLHLLTRSTFFWSSGHFYYHQKSEMIVLEESICFSGSIA